MRRYIFYRLVQVIPVMFLISLFIFVLMRVVCQDPIYALIGETGEAITPEMHARIAHEYGLDRPLPIQYFKWLAGIAKGDWGTSFRTKRPVIQEFAARLPHTLHLAIGAFVLGSILGLVTGVVAALTRNSVLDVIATTSAMFGVAVPNFWLALMLILIFSVQFRLLPTHGSLMIWDAPAASLKHLVLPTVALGVAGAATIMRQTRSAMLEVMGEDYIRTARSKGLTGNRVIWVHALRNSLLPVVTILGVRLARILSGTIIIEAMFSWPGIGRLAVDSLINADYPVVQVIVVLMAALVIFANLLTDITYAYLDPRIRYA